MIIFTLMRCLKCRTKYKTLKIFTNVPLNVYFIFFFAFGCSVATAGGHKSSITIKKAVI